MVGARVRDVLQKKQQDVYARQVSNAQTLHSMEHQIAHKACMIALVLALKIVRLWATLKLSVPQTGHPTREPIIGYTVRSLVRSPDATGDQRHRALLRQHPPHV